jgi:hypothetical protein
MLRIWRHGEVRTWKLSDSEFCAGLRALSFVPPLTFSKTTFGTFVRQPGYTDMDGKIGRNGFQRLIADQTMTHHMRQLAQGMARCADFEGPWCRETVQPFLAGLAAAVRSNYI